jgi:hypothetical protein
MAKPSEVPAWATTGTIVTPSSGKRATGWVTGEKAPAQWFNWYMNRVGQWCTWLNGLQAELLTWTARQTFTGGVTVSGTSSFASATTFDVDGAGWQTLTLNTGGNWAADTSSGNYLAPAYRIDSFGRVFFRGQARRSSGFNTKIAPLPAGIQVNAAWKLPYRFTCAAEVSGSLTACVVNVYVTGGSIGGGNDNYLIIHAGAIGAADDAVLSVDLSGIGPYYRA